MTTYKIDYTDNFNTGKTPIIVSPGKRDDQLSISLFGQGNLVYGEGLNENFIRLLENFASPLVPTNPTVGQLWYDYANNVVNIYAHSKIWVVDSIIFVGSQYTGTPAVDTLWYNTNDSTIYKWTNNLWTPYVLSVPITKPISPEPADGSYWFDGVNVERYIKNSWQIANAAANNQAMPTDPTLGELWFNPANDILYYWNGSQWVPILNPDNMTQDLNMNGYAITNLADPINPQDAATKHYVDTSIDQLNDIYVHKAGDTMTGSLHVPTVSLLDIGSTVVNKDYAVNKAGDTMTGSLHVPTVLPSDAGSTVVNKDYAVNKAGDTMTGSLQVNGNVQAVNIQSATGQVTNKPVNSTDVVRLSDLQSIPTDLMITTIGSLDLQFSVVNAYSSSVNQTGTPGYISNFSNTPNNPMLNYGPTTGNTPQTVPPYILGNATSLGEDYTVINAQYGTLLGGYSVVNPSPGVYYTYNVSGTVTMVLDIATASGLESTEYLSDGTINPKWRGNFKFSAFSSLFKMHESNFWDYTSSNGHSASTFEYSINMTPFTYDYTDPNYGKYTVTAKVYAASSYHSANLGARWMGLAVKVRNI
jgi:hypothetical protein